MSKRYLRWLMPLIALLMVAACLAFSPILSSHAAPAQPSAPAQISVPVIPAHHAAGSHPNLLWRP